MISDIKIVDTKILSDDGYTLKKVTYEYLKTDGTLKKQSREVYDRGNAATILLYNKEQQTVILTKQFRLPSFVNGNHTGMLIEACAGLMDESNPEDCAKREAEEETGYRITHARKIFEVYMSAGSLTELLYFFVAEYDASMKVSKGGGVEKEEENIDVLEMPFQQAMEMIDNGEIKDAKTIMLLQYVKLHNLM